MHLGFAHAHRHVKLSKRRLELGDIIIARGERKVLLMFIPPPSLLYSPR